MDEDATVIVDVHYNGTFVPKPLVYFAPDRSSVRDVNFKVMEFPEFIGFLDKLTRRKCKDVYYCPPEEVLSKGLCTLQNQSDYVEFLECAYEKKRVTVYVDHYNEPLFDWIALEDPDEDSDYDGANYEDEDDDKMLPYHEECEHEEDDGVVSLRRAVRGQQDKFLNILCPDPINDNDEVDASDRRPIYPVHNADQTWDEFTPVLGMKFTNPDELKYCLANYAVKYGYDLWFEKNDKSRLLVKCCKHKDPTCPFRLWASWMKNERTFQIKSLKSSHNCSRAFKLGSIVTYKWIGKQYVNEILQRPKIPLRKMKAEISKKYNIIVSVGQCRNAKKFAMSEIEGSLKEHYAKLWDYGNEIKRTNPGSTVKMEVDIQPDSTTLFSQYYVCFKGVRDGWLEGCRKIICIDGCFLKGICRGELLSAVGRDANNHYYPIAWAVVNVEKKDTWKWFLDLLMDDINGGNGNGITIMSDGHKGLIEAIKERVPEVEHRLCARHILANFNKRFKGEHFIKPFWKAVKATTKQKHEDAMKEIKNLDSRAYDYLMQRDPKYFCRAFFVEGMNCDAMENGISESFNAAIEEARRKPIIAMLEDIRIYVMQRLNHHREKGMTWDLTICPAIKMKIEKMEISQRFWTVIACGYQQFEASLGSDRYAIDLNKRECGCRGWQLSGIPCVHAVAAISSLNLHAENYIASCYSKASFMNSYTYIIHPLNDCSLWPHGDFHNPLPPKRRRLPGRPKIKRNRDQSERDISGKTRNTVSRVGMVQNCTICHLTGHNKSRCPKKPKTKSGKKSGMDGSGPSNAGPNPTPTQVHLTQTPVAAIPVAAIPHSRATQSGTQMATQISTLRTSPRATPSAVQLRQRKYSERIVKLALRRKVVPKDGSGCNSKKAVDLD